MAQPSGVQIGLIQPPPPITNQTDQPRSQKVEARPFIEGGKPQSIELTFSDNLGV